MHKNINPKSLHKHMGTNTIYQFTKHNISGKKKSINNIYKRLNPDCKLRVRNKNTPKPQCINSYKHKKYKPISLKVKT